MAQVSVGVPMPVCVPKTEPCESVCNSSSHDLSLSSLEPLIPFTAPNKLKDPVVVLERCDKIWKTLTLIKELQTTSSSTVKHSDKRESKTSENSKESESSNEKQDPVSYVTYQPMLVNDVSSLPNLKISVKNRKRLYHCATCGKQYSESRALRRHSERIHGIVIPLKRAYRRYKSKSESDKLEGSERDTMRLNEEETATNVNSGMGKITTEKEQPKTSAIATDPVEKIKQSVHSKPRPRSFPQNNTVPKQIPSQKSENPPILQKAMQIEKSPTTTNLKETSEAQPSFICVLCQQKVKNIRQHLIEYHKIECPDIMIQQFGKSLSKDLNTQTVKPEVQKKLTAEPVQEKVEKTVEEPHVTRPMKRIEKDTDENKKRKFPTVMMRPRKKAKHIPVTQNQNDLSDANSAQGKVKYQCDICCGVYSNRINLTKHKRKHTKNGETKDKLHLFAFRYRRSPYYTKPKDLVTKNVGKSSALSTGNTVRSSDKNDSGASLGTKKQVSAKKQLNTKSSDFGTHKCKCGKLFRQAHTLHLHKKKCTVYIQESQEDVRSSSDRDSGIGINITIKKKNNSYEIVGKDDGNEIKSKHRKSRLQNVPSGGPDYTSETLNNTLTKDKNFNILESSKYSKEHSVLKLEFVDEDMEVDIEEEDAKQNVLNTAVNEIRSTDENVSSTTQKNSNTDNTIEQTCMIDPLVICKTEMDVD